LRGIARSNRERPIRKALPVLDDDIQRLIDNIDTTSVSGIRDRALLLIGFDAALRRSELVAIQHEHIAYRDDGLLITIPYSKTDQVGSGAEVGVLARPESPYCPVMALEQWKMASGVEVGAVFRRVYKGGNIGLDALTDRNVSPLIKSRAGLAGFKASDIKQLSGHSLRRGFITSAANSGQPLVSLMKQTRHKKTDSLIGYVESVDLLAEHPGKNLLKQ